MTRPTVLAVRRGLFVSSIFAFIFISGENVVGQKRIELSGPRVGFTLITGKEAETLKTKLDASPFITQLGWQFEGQVLSRKENFSGLYEFVPLIGGVDQGLFLPSISGLYGIRQSKGYEFGVGINFSLSGLALVIACGATIQSEGFNFPVNFAFTSSRTGRRFSLLTGYNVRD